MNLNRVMSALLKSMERATRLLATGESTAKGARPIWLEESINFVVKGVKPGSTRFVLDAPRVLDTAGEHFAQKDFWRESPGVDDTALDLLSMAVEEVLSGNETSERYDSALLDSFGELQRAIKTPGVRFSLHKEGQNVPLFQLAETEFSRIAQRKRAMPPQKAFVISGILDEIKHSAGRFLLVLGNGHKLPGRVHPEYLDGEMLRELWGKEATVEGMVHFKMNGQARFVDARKLSPRMKGDEFFDRMPVVEEGRLEQSVLPSFEGVADSGDPMVLWGAWPGQESLEDLMGALG